MALDEAFVADCPYGPVALFLEEIVEVNLETVKVVARMTPYDDLPLTRSQRVHPVRHPRHVNGGLIVHMTGMLGFVHAYYVLDLRHADGWIGYGAKIHEARFAALARPGEPMTLMGQAIRTRRMNDNILARYRFEFHQGETLVYESEQTAMWLKVGENGDPASLHV